MTTHFKDNKERVTCTGGSLDGRELWITAGVASFVVLGTGGVRETFVRNRCQQPDGRFVFEMEEEKPERRTVEMPCSQ